MVRDSSITKRGFALTLAVCALALPSAGWAASTDGARITSLADLAFGTLSTASDQTLTENVCAFSNSATSGYSVTASGDGAGGAFELSTGSFTLPYEVSWAGSSNRGTGTALTARSAMSGFISPANQQTCNNLPSNSATLLVTIRSAAAASARVGSYSGVLTITLTPQ